MSKFLIACGGTGGHLVPGIALAQGLIKEGHDCILLISNKEVDSRLLKKYPELGYRRVPGVGFSRNPLGMIRFIYEQVRGVFYCLNLIDKEKPDMVIGFGGYTTVGLAVGGYIMGVPVVLHEANRVIGRAVRYLSGMARRVYLPFGVKLRGMLPKTLKHMGYPVRKEIRSMNRGIACDRLGVKAERKRLLVMGGSQGASVLNGWVEGNYERLGEMGVDIYCVTGLGKGGEGRVEATFKNGVIAEVVFKQFIDNVAEVLSACDLVVARAGAGSIAEFCRCGIPGILIPYPYAADNHQQENAAFFERQGCGIVLRESEMDRLTEEVMQLIFNDELLEKFQKNELNQEVEKTLDMIIGDLEELCLESKEAGVNSKVGNGGRHE